MIYFSSNEDLSFVSIMVFGQYFLVFGVIALFSSLKGGERKATLFLVPIFILLVGVACIFIPLFVKYPIILESINIKVDWDFLIPLLMLLVFFSVGAGVFINAIVKRKKYNKLDLIVVAGKVIDLQEIIDDNTKMYAPVIEYEHEGTKVYKSNSYTNVNVPHIGDIINIKIDPLTKKVYYESNIEFYISIIMGIVFMVFVGFSIYALFTQY